MNNRHFVYIWDIIYLLQNLLFLTGEELLNNPYLMSFSSNPFIFNTEEQIQFYFSNQKYSQDPSTREMSSQEDFCTITDVNTLILNEETNKYYLYTKSSQYIISITDNDCQSKQISNTEIFQNTEYIGNIFEGVFNPLEFYSLGSSQSKIYLRCTQLSNEIIIYGKIDNDVGFYFLEKDLMLNLGINCDVEDSFYCNKIDNSVYICVYLCNNKINVHFFAYATPEANANGNCEIKNILTSTVKQSSSYNNLMVVEKDENLLICARNEGNNNVECYSGRYTYNEYEINNEENDGENNGDGNYGNENNDNENGENENNGNENNGDESKTIINDFNVTFEYSQNTIASLTSDYENNQYCALKNSIINEYLLCCVGENSINCIRFNNDFNLINSFNLVLQGTKTYINLITSSEYIHIIYKNNSNSMYEYSIYSPECADKTYSLFPLGSITDDVNNLFTRKTNTKYYIKIVSFSSSHLNIKFNNELLESNLTSFDPVLIDDEYNIEIISTASEAIDDLELNYQVILEETFSSNCTAKINILECYKSCELCTKTNIDSDEENHNCVAGKCNINYYQDPDIETNCWDIYEAQPNWYLDYEQNKFFYCNEECPTCDGPTNEDCRSCKADSDKKYLFNKKCLTECPDGYYPKPQSSGYYICTECYSTCETCSGEGDRYNMNCLSCKSNSISWSRNCFQIADSTLKTFIRPWDGLLSSCYEEYNYYIKDDTNACISKIPEEYYLSNAQTGVISPCHSDCKKCREGPTETNTNCLICKNEDLNFFNGNCVVKCDEGYYSKPKSETNLYKKCEKCFMNCKKCVLGEEYGSGRKLLNMNCDECKKDENNLNIFIKVIKNCFTIGDYEENKINFDTSLINSNAADKIKTCYNYDLSIIYGEYECKTKPTNSYYIQTDEGNNGIVKYCDIACATCNLGKDDSTGNTNCLTCSSGYYKTEDSDTNCILESLIPINYYRYSGDNIYYKCYNLCTKCVRILNYKTSQEKMGCASCVANFYLEQDTPNCYDRTFLDTHTDYYLSLEDNTFKKCYFSCAKCSEGHLDEHNHNCDECKQDYYFEDGTKNCYDISITENGYYLDDFTINVDLGEKPVFKKCYASCKTCSNYLIEENMNCITCIEGFFLLNGTNNCIDDITSKGYYGKDNIAYPCEENCLTCSDGKTPLTENNLNNDFEVITDISYNCLSCDEENKGLFLVENINNCENEDFKNKGFYLEELEDNTKIFKKCHETCSLCDNGLEIDPVTNEENHNCEKCAKNYYPLFEDVHEKNCYGNEMLTKGYLLVRNYWRICHENCDTCTSGPTYDSENGISHNCITCYTGYNFVYNTNNCENETFTEKGYYLDDNDHFYKKCDISCRTCDKYSNSENPNCKTCNNDGSYYPAEEKPSSICYNKTMIAEEEGERDYVLSERTDEEGNSYKIWGFCYELCVKCSKFGNDQEHGCTSCIPKYYLIYGSSNCVTDYYATNNGYYFNKTFLQYVACDESCINCYGSPKEGTTNCKKCNNAKGYYNIEGKTNTLCRSEKTIEEGYFLNTLSNPYTWSECYEKCARCDYKGIETKMKCLSCRTNLKNYLNKTKYFLLIDGNCIESCENNLFLTKEGDCVSECPLGTYQFILNYNYSCLESCPPKYKISSDEKRCELELFPKNITIKDFKNLITNELNDNVNSSKIMNFENFKARIVSSNDLSLNTFNSKQIFSVDNLEEILNQIKLANNLETDANIIITQIEYETNLENNNKMNLGTNIEILLYDSFGNKLVIPDNIYTKFSLTKYVGNLIYINFDESKWFYDKGINVFNESDSFFNDICYPFETKYGSDVTLEDRRNNYFQDVNFCGENCQFDKLDYQLMNVICLCNSSLLNTEINTEKGILLNNNKFTKDLYKTNLIVMKCINLVFDSNIIKSNVGFITNMIFLSSEVIFFTIFIINGLKPIKNFILIFEPNSNAAPPKLSTLLALAETKKTKDEEIQKSKLINHLINAKKSKKNSNKHEMDDALVVDYENEENNNDSKLNQKFKNNINNQSESSESNSKKSPEKTTTIRRYKSEKRRSRVKNFKVETKEINKSKNSDEMEDNKKNKKQNIQFNEIEKDMDEDLIKRHMNLGNIHISNYNYLNKNTEEVDLESNHDKNKVNKVSEKKKKKNVKKIKNEAKNNNLYLRQEFLFMDYEEAIKNDKIKFSEVFLTYLIENHFILNTIISDSFINLITIKISYLSFRIELILVLNALFYSDNYISQVFENEGKLDFFISLPKAIYSLLITILICIPLKFLLNNKEEVFNLIKNKDKVKFNSIMEKMLPKIKTKLIIYFSIQFAFTLFFLYYCSSFCAVYQNSQMFWIYGCLETILFDAIFSCLYCLLLTSCRLLSIKKRIKCLYTVTKIINYV